MKSLAAAIGAVAAAAAAPLAAAIPGALVCASLLLWSPVAQAADPYAHARERLKLDDSLDDALGSALKFLAAAHPSEARALDAQGVWRTRARVAAGDSRLVERGLFARAGAYVSPLALDALLEVPPVELEAAARAALGALERWRRVDDVEWDRAVFAEAEAQVSLVAGEVERERTARARLVEARAAEVRWKQASSDDAAARAWVAGLIEGARYADGVAAFEQAVSARGCGFLDGKTLGAVELALELVGGTSAAQARCRAELLHGGTREIAVEPEAAFGLPAQVADELVTDSKLGRWLELADKAFAARPREHALYGYLLALRCVEREARGLPADCDAEALTRAVSDDRSSPWPRLRGLLLRGRHLRDRGRYQDSLVTLTIARAAVTELGGGPALEAESLVEEGNALVFVDDVEGAALRYDEADKAVTALRAARLETHADALASVLRGNRALIGYARLRLEAARGDELDADTYEATRADLEAAEAQAGTLAPELGRDAQLDAVGTNLLALHLLGARTFGDAARRSSSLAAARAQLERIEKRSTGGAPRHAAALAVNRCALARTAAQGGDRKALLDGKKTCDAAVRITAAVADYHFRALHERALVRGALGDRKGALDDLEAAVSLVEDLRAGLGDDAQKAGFLYDKDLLYSDAIRYAATDGKDPARALRFGERMRARHFLDLVRRARDGHAGDDAAARKQVVDHPERIDLGAHTFVVSYFLGRDFALALVVKPDHRVVAVHLGDSRKPLDAAADRWRTEVMSTVSNLRPGKLASSDKEGGFAWQDRLAELYALLFEKVDAEVIAPACRGADAVCTVGIVAQGLLHHVPFGALVVGKDVGKDATSSLWPRPRYLLDRYAIFYAPSVSSLGQLVIGHPPTEKSLIVTYAGDDLPEVRHEVDRILRVLPEVAELTGGAPRSKLIEELTHRPVVMIAAHGELNPREPMASRLILSAGGAVHASSGASSSSSPSEDLTLGDLLRLRLDGEAIYLSACETAQVEPWLVQGDDYLSLARGFLAAGANEVIATLWRLVDVAGGEVSTRFFASVYQGGHRSSVPRAQALRAAMLGALEFKMKDGTPIGRSPLFFAPFVLTGDPR